MRRHTHSHSTGLAIGALLGGAALVVGGKMLMDNKNVRRNMTKITDTVSTLFDDLSYFLK